MIWEAITGAGLAVAALGGVVFVYKTPKERAREREAAEQALAAALASPTSLRSIKAAHQWSAMDTLPAHLSREWDVKNPNGEAFLLGIDGARLTAYRRGYTKKSPADDPAGQWEKFFSAEFSEGDRIEAVREDYRVQTREYVAGQNGSAGHYRYSHRMESGHDIVFVDTGGHATRILPVKIKSNVTATNIVSGLRQRLGEGLPPAVAQTSEGFQL